VATTLDPYTYDGLQEIVARYLQRANLGDMLPIFIADAEARLADLIKTLPAQVAKSPYTLVPVLGTTSIELPSDCGAIIRVTYDDRPMQYISPEQLDSEKGKNRANQFTKLGSRLLLQTYVDGVSTLSVYYYRQWERLSDFNESNWLLEDYPNIYKYATLLEAVTYIKDDEEIQKWSSMLAEVLQKAKDAAVVENTPQLTKLTRTRS